MSRKRIRSVQYFFPHNHMPGAEGFENLPPVEADMNSMEPALDLSEVEREMEKLMKMEA